MQTLLKTINERRRAQEVGLLSLPDELLAKIALETRDWEEHEPLIHWVEASSTCKRLWELQLPCASVIDSFEGLIWHLRRCQHVPSIRIRIERWPRSAEDFQNLGSSLMKVSCNLRRLERLEFWPIRSSIGRPFLKPWTSGLLSGASSLKHADLDQDMLPCLPMPRRKALKSLYIDAFFETDKAVQDVVQAVLDCQQLTNLRITAYSQGWHFPALDLRHLQHLSVCELKRLPAPNSILLSEGTLQPTMTFGQCTLWSKLWQQVHNRVHFLTVTGFHSITRGGICSEVVQAWPEGIDAFHGLQCLELDFSNLWPCSAALDDLLDIAILAYIPQVSLRSMHDLHIKISRGSWKILDLESKGTLIVLFGDAEAFLTSTSAFYFRYNIDGRPSDLTGEMTKAGAATGTTLYEYRNSNDEPLCDESDGYNPPLVHSSNQKEERRSNGYLVDRFKRAALSKQCE